MTERLLVSCNYFSVFPFYVQPYISKPSRESLYFSNLTQYWNIACELSTLSSVPLAVCLMSMIQVRKVSHCKTKVRWVTQFLPCIDYRLCPSETKEQKQINFAALFRTLWSNRGCRFRCYQFKKTTATNGMIISGLKCSNDVLRDHEISWTQLINVSQDISKTNKSETLLKPLKYWLLYLVLCCKVRN